MEDLGQPGKWLENHPLSTNNADAQGKVNALMEEGFVYLFVYWIQRTCSVVLHDNECTLIVTTMVVFVPTAVLPALLTFIN